MLKKSILLLSSIAILSGLTAPLPAQQVPEGIIIRDLRPGVIELAAPAQIEAIQGPSVSLKTDPELEAILEKAERFRKEGQYSVASKLWQSVLERSGDALYSADGKIYFSLAEQVEAILANLPLDGGLQSYRISADANAKAILAKAGEPFDETALRKVVRLYFLSSVGDDAAFKLSSIYMDQFDFVGAYRMLEKIVRNYPDPSVSMIEVHVRMALCQAMMGEEQNARDALQQARLRSEGTDNRSLAAVEAAIPKMIQQKIGKQLSDEFGMLLANRSRSGLMPALPDRYLKSNLQTAWQYYFLPKTLRWPDLREITPLVGDNIMAEMEDTIFNEEEAMIERWRKNRWRPAGLLLFDDDNVYFKTSLDLTVWNRDKLDQDVVWRPLWRNKYQMDNLTSWMIESQSKLGRSATNMQNMPTKTYEVQLFGDRIASQMSIQDGVLYTIEGPRFDNTFISYEPTRSIRFGVSFRRSRANQLTAYDATNGKLLWTLPKIIDEKQADKLNNDADESLEVPLMEDESAEGDWLTSGGFMAAPIQYGGLLIVPVNQSGAISIYALDPAEQGKTVWKSYLCDEPENGASPNSPINLSIDGSDLFASCGLGVVFILDPTTGLVRFAKPYERGGIVQRNNTSRWNRGFGLRINRTQYAEWLTDTIIPFGRQMVCFSSDAKSIQALDRNTGELIWRGNAQPLEAKVDYVIGVYNDILYAAGADTILAFNLAEEGRMIWGGNKMFDGEVSLGRGMVTRNGVFVPVGDHIRLYSHDGNSGQPELLRKINVRLGTGAPIGNLFSDGDRIWVHGANRIYALDPIP